MGPPLTGIAVNEALSPEQIDELVDVIDTDGITFDVVIVITLLFAVVVMAHGSLLAINAIILSVFERVVVVNAAAVSPGTVVPFICHTKVGATPPLKGNAVKVMLPPEQIDVVVDVIDTDGITLDTITATASRVSLSQPLIVWLA